MNFLFETSFDTLDATKGRNQTTRGIHLSFNPDCKSLVIDIEGTDSQVRGEDGQAFEHMSALFALAISDVLMVNMWTSEIGRYKAASVGLLKTIFEVNLKLFGVEGRKRILFVLRDFNDEKNNLLILKQQISKTMEEIWDKIKKPSTHALSTVFDCFEFDFHTISVKDFKPEEFVRDIQVLKDKFSNKERNDYLFRCKNTDIPVDGISVYFSEIWNIIHSDKDLNIPSQKEMLANLRCSELKLEALKKFSEEAAGLTGQAGKSLIPDLGQSFNSYFDSALSSYDEHGSAYFESTYRKVREELSQSLFDLAREIYSQQMRFIVSLSIQKTREGFVHYFPKSASVDNFRHLASKIHSEVASEFKFLSSSSILPGSSWSTEEYEQEFETFFTEKQNDEREKQESLLEKEVSKAFDVKFNNEISKILDQAADQDVWPRLRSVQVETLHQLESRTERALENLGKEDKERTAYIQQIRLKCIENIRQRLERFTKGLEDYLMRRFNILFSKDERGIPRDPRSTNYEEIFPKCMNRVVPVLEYFRYFKLSTDWEETLAEGHYPELLSEEEYLKIKESFTRDADRAYKDALHIKEFGYGRGGVPKWAILLLVLLGWNEFLWVLTNPFILYPAMLVGSLVAVMFSMGLGAIPKAIFSQIIMKVPYLL